MLRIYRIVLRQLRARSRYAEWIGGGGLDTVREGGGNRQRCSRAPHSRYIRSAETEGRTTKALTDRGSSPTNHRILQRSCASRRYNLLTTDNRNNDINNNGDDTNNTSPLYQHRRYRNVTRRRLHFHNYQYLKQLSLLLTIHWQNGRSMAQNEKGER